MFTESYKKRSDLHTARKLWHIGMVGTMAISYIYFPLRLSIGVLFLAWLLFVPLDFLRQTRPRLNEVLVRLFKPIIRENEVSRLAGTSYLLTGVAVITIFFPRDIVICTLFFLALADPIASYVGIRFGKDKIVGNKSLQGSLAAFVVCASVTAFYLYFKTIENDKIAILALLGGLAGALAELLPVGNLDDNFTLPILSSLFLWAIFYFFGMQTLLTGVT